MLKIGSSYFEFLSGFYYWYLRYRWKKYSLIFLSNTATGKVLVLINCGFWYVAVYATMRNLAKKDPLEEAAGHSLGKTLEIKQLDVCDEQSIKTCVNSIPDRRIDVLGKYGMWTDKYCLFVSSNTLEELHQCIFSHD